MPDVLVISGLTCLGFGLWLYEPWVSYSVVGAIVLIGGLLMGRPQDNNQVYQPKSSAGNPNPPPRYP